MATLARRSSVGREPGAGRFLRTGAVAGQLPWLADPGENCLQVITPGWSILLDATESAMRSTLMRRGPGCE